MARVFLSYRRTDTAGHAGRLAEALNERFGRGAVFMDIDSIGPGADFHERIDKSLGASNVALILIGDEWLASTGPEGRRRIDDEQDVVRREVAAALRRPGLVVIPVLVEGTRMPAESELPDELAPLARRNAFDLSNKRWSYDVSQLGDTIESAAPVPLRRRIVRRLGGRPLRVALAIVVPAAVAAAIVIATAGGGGGTAKPTAADRVASCQRRHGLGRARQTRPARSGESRIERNATVLSQDAFLSCTWPPEPGADQDGYRAIVVTKVNGPEQGEFTGRNVADRIESNCKRLSLAYVFGSIGTFKRLPPFAAAPGEFWGLNDPLQGPDDHFVRLDPGQINLPFYPGGQEVVVLRNFKTSLDQPSCAG